MLRFTPEEFEKLQARIKQGVERRQAASVQQSRTRKAKGEGSNKRNKYGAQAVEIDGIHFDSKSEGKRYLQLKAMEQVGEISSLELQVKYELIPAQEIQGRKEKPVFYVADFRYVRDGQIIIEDTKSGPTKTREYIIKRKLMMQRYGIVISEVLMD